MGLCLAQWQIQLHKKHNLRVSDLSFSFVHSKWIFGHFLATKLESQKDCAKKANGVFFFPCPFFPPLPPTRNNIFPFIFDNTICFDCGKSYPFKEANNLAAASWTDVEVKRTLYTTNLCHGQRWDLNRECDRMSYPASTLTLGVLNNRDLFSTKVQIISPNVEGNRRVSNTDLTFERSSCFSEIKHEYKKAQLDYILGHLSGILGQYTPKE